MDTESKENPEPETKNEEPLNYHSPNMSSEWQINGTNLSNSSMGLIPHSSNGPMAFCPNIWDQPSSSQHLGFSDMHLQHNASVSPPLVARNIMPGPLGGGMGWAPPQHPMLRGGGMFLPTVPGLHPQSLAQIPADSGFIERAARFSCFSAGNFADIMNPFSSPEPLNPYRGIAPMQRPQGIISAGNNPMNSMQGMLSQRDEINTLNSKGSTVQFDHGATTRSPLKSEGKSEIHARSHDEGKQGTNGASELGSEEGEFSSRNGAQEELEGTVGASSLKGLGSKKRKRTGQDSQIDENNGAAEVRDETTNNHTEFQHNEDQNTTSTATNPGGKNGNQDPQTSDQPKEDYIHVRARRGQATNSHSLAERVRREKISERMKFLQDLVPGCSKVTGKAVMLDEIINYVQSLQRQVEFLSMKLATVNPRLDINIESLFNKDMHQSRAGPSSSLAFPHDLTMPYHPALHSNPPGLMQAGLLGMGGSSDALRRFINPEFTNMAGGYKEPMPQTDSWEDELHGVIQMGLNSVAPQTSQDLNASLPSGNTKAEM
ncbi:hypothetical protein LIER_33252 [Lithospermum erythrorhizon]|uniref:BHLH domain-containing protein n=1 Tax=Lithospermum erythrorhizon TaxID=34254 RepID=A0AAV3RX31_LITER